MSDEYIPEGEETRLCPVCRMPISILATRCRYCGETVGRPRKAEDQKSVEDLGGESQSRYTLSGNVMEALEAFREEELSAQEAEQKRRREELEKSWFRGRPREAESDEHHSDADLPEYPSGPPEFETGRSPSPPPAGKKRAAGLDTNQVVVRVAAGVAAVVALYVIVVYGWPLAWGLVAGWGAGDQPVYENRARSMLEAGRPPIEALEEAIKALNVNNTPENQKIAEEVRTAFIEKITGMVNAEPFDKEQLDRASSLATRAAGIDSNPRIQDLANTVSAEVAAYRMVLVEIDETEAKATFRLHNPDYPKDEEIVEEGELVQDRFLVKRIYPSYVRLVDTRRDERVLICRKFGTVTGA